MRADGEAEWEAMQSPQFIKGLRASVFPVRYLIVMTGRLH
jgi:hypothetical protein